MRAENFTEIWEGLIDYHELLNVKLLTFQSHKMPFDFYQFSEATKLTFIFSEVYFRIRSPVNRQIIESRMKLYDFSGKSICIIYLGKV